MRARSTRPVASVRERVILANAQHWSGSIESVMTRRAATIASPGDARPLLTISRVHCIRPYNILTIWIFVLVINLNEYAADRIIVWCRASGRQDEPDQPFSVGGLPRKRVAGRR